MNEVEETLRVLNNQIEECGIRHDSYQIAYDEFTMKCEDIIDKEVFYFIKGMLFKAMKFYDNKLNESLKVRKDILDKYNIPYDKSKEGL